MGNYMKHSFTNLRVREDRDALSRTECYAFDVIKKIWQAVEKDSAYYGFAFCTVLFQNHPQYAKYFEEESIPEFVREAKVKKKFTVIYNIVCALFIDYKDKPSQREYLLGYIAMVHKDMALTLNDFENFMSDLLETLTIELSDIMTEEYILIQMKYLNDLIDVLPGLMEQQRKKLDRIMQTSPAITNCCAWRRDPHSQTIYGFPLRYWLSKRRYWEYRKAIWASIEINSLTPIMDNPVLYKGTSSTTSPQTSMDVRMIKDMKLLEITSTDKSDNSKSDISNEPEGVSRKYSRIIQNRRDSQLQENVQEKRRSLEMYKPRKSFMGFSPMETIQESDKMAAQISPSKMTNISSDCAVTLNLPEETTALCARNLDSQTDAAKDAIALSGYMARKRRRESKILPYAPP